MQRHRVVAAVRPAFGDGTHHVDHAQATRIAVVRALVDHAGEGAGLARHLDLAAEAVGVGADQRAVVAVELEGRVGVLPDIEAGGQHEVRAAGKRQVADDVGGHRHRDLLAGALAQRHGAHRVGGVGDAAHLGDRPQVVHQVAEVVDAHVKQRARARLVEKGRVGVPVVGAVVHEEGGAVAHRADHAGIELRPHRLRTRTQQRVRGAAQAQLFLLGQRDHFLALRKGGGQRLLGEEVLAGLQGAQAEFVVGLRRRQVEDDLGLAGQQLIHRHRLQASGRKFSGTALRRSQVGVGDADQAQRAGALRLEQVAQVGREDVAGAENAEGQGHGGDQYWLVG